MLNKELAKMMKTMEDVLPSKLKLRKDIKSHIQLVRQFNSLMSIVNRRKTKLLIRNKEALLPEVASLMNEQNETATALHDAKIKEASSESLKSYHRKQQRMMLSKKMEVHAVIYDSSADLSEPLAQVYQSFSASITSVMEILEEVHRVFINVEDFAESTFSKSHAQLVAVQLQLMLNSMQKEGNQEKMRNLLNFMLTSADKNLQAFKTEIDELTKEIEKSRAVALKPLDISEEYYRKGLEELNSSVFNLRNMITKVGMEIYTNEKLVEDFQFDIEDLALKGKVDMKFVKTLQAIEGFVLSLDARLSADYLGPVFQHLKSVPELDDKIWPLIASKAQIFLFIRGSTARMVNKMMIESGVNQGPFVFMGLDEFVANNLTAVEDELKDQVKSASLLVKSDVRFAKILKKLLGEVILLENNAILSQIPSDRIVVTFSEAGITSKSNGYLTITSVPYKLTDMQDYSTIDFLQNIYANVTQQVAVLKKIEVARASQLELEAFLKVEIEQAESIGLKDCMAVNKAVVALHELYQLLRGRSEVQMMFHKEEALSLELKGFKNKEPWDENEMIDARTALEEKFTADEDRLIRLQNELRRTDMKFDGVMHNIGISQIKLTGIFTRLVVADSFNKEAKKINDNILAQLEKELKAVYKFLRKKSSPPSDDTEMRLKLHEVGYQLYKKNSQMSVINSAFRLCQATDSVIDQSLYDEFKRQSGEAIAVELAEIRQGLQQHAHSVQLEPINLEQYGHLFETIKKVKNYSESPPRMMTRSKVTAKAFPLGNQLIVQILKDVVYNFEISFNYLLTEFNQRSTLYFYTVGMFEAIKKDDLSWDSFDMRRLKAMDFSTDWKGEKISSTSLKRIKGLLLILHIISSMSIFKFVIIEEKFFDVS